ncbi:hypothetical protein N7468_010225 [Penicillium chermesinum]|uniref:Uncharacterized protein n=1 Tax=Penicillium chermesinum TaxID=63820 RepID=A0A9W9TC21_9EURO|nr:uncharacterized protein N7468_010225 [Penicillium chermesinum]KAJ5217217.1 hypothetical protein N7468_010225 [Penicillium chermesinum]KAJ6171167.1 hypothetical protein N7470_000234 [Penicillium chermesinum]
MLSFPVKERVKNFQFYRGCFFPKQWRDRKLILYLMAAEFPFVVAMLTLTGVASHDTYQSLLWKVGYQNGFNSSPDEAIYAAANYRPYKAPIVWSSFLTTYNLVIAVLSVFLLITKIPVHALHLYYPPIATAIHAASTTLFVIAACFQAGPDMSDPTHPQPGAPWYITKSCSVAKSSTIIGYCRQAKGLFGLTIVLCVLYFVEFLVSARSCFITREERLVIIEEREEKKVEREFEEEIMKSPLYPATPGFTNFHPGMMPRTPGFPPMAARGPMPAPTSPFAGSSPSSPFGPRRLAFNRLPSTSSDLPLRNNSNDSTQHIVEQPKGDEPQAGPAPVAPMYFPPPPKKAAKT